VKQIEYHKESSTWIPQGIEIREEIQWDSDTDAVDQIPMILVDDKELTWQEFGKTMLTHEGFHFVLQFVDPTAKL
jgi:hypothetical protein